MIPYNDVSALMAEVTMLERRQGQLLISYHSRKESNKMANTKFAEMRKKLEVLERLDKELDNVLKNYLFEYKCIKEEVTDQQETHWRTDEPLWEDEAKTIPKMHVDRTYDYVRKDANEVTDEDRLTEKIVAELRKALEKLM